MQDISFFLFLFSIGVFFIPVISQWTSLPIIVLEISYGFSLRLLFPNQVLDYELIDFIAQMGFMLLMFLTGLEVNFRIGNKKEFLFPCISVVTMLFCAFIVIKMLTIPISSLFYFTLISATSGGIIFITLKLKNIENTSYGRKLIWLASIGEMITIFLIIVFDVLHQNHGDLNLKFFLDISRFFTILFIAYLLIEFILFLLWKFPKWADRLEINDTFQIRMRMIFFIMLLMISLSVFFNLEAILGAFLGGLMVSFIFRKKELIEKNIASIAYGFFIPFFFIKIGWDIEYEVENLLMVFASGIILYAIMLFIRLIGSFILSFSTEKSNKISLKNSIREALATTFLWSAPISLIIAIAKIGTEIQAIDNTAYFIILTSAIIGGTIGPIGFNIFYPKKIKKEIR